MFDAATLELPAPRLAEGRTASIDYYTDDALFGAIGVRIAFFERFGGASGGPYESLNLGDHVEDDLNCVLENRRRALRALGCDFGIATRPGAHCAPLMHRALGTEAQGAVRFSFGYFNTTGDADAAAQAVKEIALGR